MKPIRPQVLLTTKFEATYNREMLRGVVAYTRQHTNWQLICRALLPPADQRRLRPAGVLVTGVAPHVNRWAQKIGAPFVIIGATTGDPRDSIVSADDVLIGKMAVDYFADMGLKHIAYVGHGTWPFVHDRLRGVLEGAQQHNCTPICRILRSFDNPARRPRFEADLEAMLRSLPRPCGVLAASDILGVLIIDICRRVGLRVPDDLAVLGVDDDQLACELSEIPLSSIAQPLTAIGYEAARMLHQRMRQPTRPPAQLLLPPLRVVPRASTDLIAMADEDVVQAMRLINFHFAEPINVDWVTRQMPVARRSLYRKFQKCLGRTILEQIHHVRFQKAKELLAESDLALEVVAQRSGFANARWMANSFRRELKITPNRFRRQFRTER